MRDWYAALAPMPLIAILRGLEPDQAPAIGDALVAAGFLCVEVPLNSPRPLDSIRVLAERIGDKAIVGAGTVLAPEQVDAVAEAGGRIVVSPDSNAAVIRRAKALGLIALPGFATPSEAFAALAAGADGLKLFPAEMHRPAVLKAMKAVLPSDVPLFPVGGIGAADFDTWRAAGADGFGIGSAVYRPGIAPSELASRAETLVRAWGSPEPA